MKAIIISFAILCLPLHGQTNLPADAAHLKALRDAKVGEIDRVFVSELVKLRDKYEKAGDTAHAEATARLISETLYQDPAPPANPPNSLTALIGKWRRDYDKAIFEFKDTKSGIYGGDTPFKMTYNPEKKRVILESVKWVDSISFTLHPDILKGGHDNKIPYKLTRVK